MRKSTKLLKKFAALFLIVLISIESFAAVVGDNDGAAFITKAEFDSMKNDFQSQLDRYNSSIDNKIDGAIAAYLAGIKIDSQPNILWESLVRSMSDNPLWFANAVAVAGSYSSNIGSSYTTTQIQLNAERHYVALLSEITEIWYRWSNGLGHGIWDRNNTGLDTMSTRTLYNVEVKGNNTYSNADLPSTWVAGTAPVWSHDYTYYNAYSQLDTYQVAGFGAAWFYHERPDGKRVLREYASTCYPIMLIDSQFHTYKDFSLSTTASTAKTRFSAYYVNNNSLGDTTNHSQTVTRMTNFGSYTSGTKRTGNNTTSSSDYYNVNVQLIKTTNKKDYSVLQWGKTNGLYIYTYPDYPSLYASTSTSSRSVASGSFNTTLYQAQGSKMGSQSVYGYTLYYYPVSITPTQANLTSFICEQATSLAGELVYLGGGCPIVNVTDTDQDLEIKIKFKSRNSSHSAVNGNVNYQLSDRQFVNGTIAAGATNYGSGIWTYGTTPVTINIPNAKKGLIWINCSSVTSGYESTIDSIEVKVL